LQLVAQQDARPLAPALAGMCVAQNPIKQSPGRCLTFQLSSAGCRHAQCRTSSAAPAVHRGIPAAAHSALFKLHQQEWGPPPLLLLSPSRMARRSFCRRAVRLAPRCAPYCLYMLARNSLASPPSRNVRPPPVYRSRTISTRSNTSHSPGVYPSKFIAARMGARTAGGAQHSCVSAPAHMPADCLGRYRK
jgi:hypothetical protein